MRVFVLTTGRAGSTTFAVACAHMSNFTSGHESRSGHLLPRRLEYPDQHIEIDNRLFFYLGLLDERYGANAYYVHLIRDEEAVARSLRDRWTSEVTLARGWERTVLMRLEASEDFHDGVARDVVQAMNAGIRMFLKDKPHVRTVSLDACPDDFLRFWDEIGARGDRRAAAQEWRTRHNAGPSAAVQRRQPRPTVKAGVRGRLAALRGTRPLNPSDHE